jgi:ABC-type transporter Mla subunit MlaD
VRLENLSALGESYIGLIPNTDDGPMLRDGQHIAAQRVKAPASISQLATSTVRVLNQADPQALKRIVAEVDTALPNPNTTLPNLSRASVLLRNTAANMHGSGKDLLDNFQTLLQNAGWLGPLLADITPSLPPIGMHTDNIVGAPQQFIKYGTPQLIFNLNKYLDRIQKFLDDSGSDLKVLGEALLPQLKGISGALMNFDTGQILARVLDSVPADGAITLHVTPQN